MDTSNNFALLAIAGVLLFVAIGQYLRAEKLALMVDSQAQEIEALGWEAELAREKCLSWERKYRRVLGAKVAGVVTLRTNIN